MVKNSGGNKCKRGAQKHMTGANLRHLHEKNPEEPCEMYAVVVKLYGGSNCEVLCEDDVTRMCIIRNKFRGRGKRDNFLCTGVWVLVGTRSWEIKHSGKLLNCDLLYVYSDDEKQKLLTNVVGNWRVLQINPIDGQSDIPKDDYIVFEDTTNTCDTLLVKELQDQCGDDSTHRNIVNDDIIDIDDI